MIPNMSTRPRPRDIQHSRLLFYYGHHVDESLLQGYDLLVLDPASNCAPARVAGAGRRVLAYTSVGEVLPTRPWFSRLPAHWQLGQHAAWCSSIVDQAAADWPRFFVEHVATPCWRAGYRGFFLDTMDSYRLLRPDPACARRQQAGIIRLVRHLRAAHPKATIITNRGFELMDELHEAVDAVCFESLYGGWDQQRRQYIDVAATDRAWLLQQAARMRALGLPVIAMDYCDPAQPQRAQALRGRIRQHGLIPYVADNYFQQQPA